MNIHQRIAAVRADLPGDGYMQKNAKVSGFGGGYTALTYDKLIRVVRPYLIKHGVLVYPQFIEGLRTEGTTAKGGFVLRYSAVFDVVFQSAEDADDRYTVRVDVDANDSGDKAPPKAQTIAKRIALRSVLDIETGEDEEQRGDEIATNLAAAIVKHRTTIDAIKNALAEGDMSAAAEAWFELDNDEKRSIWAAPSKGGPFTTDERDVIKSTAFREAHYGPAKDAPE